jgi:hypothetical protein
MELGPGYDPGQRRETYRAIAKHVWRVFCGPLSPDTWPRVPQAHQLFVVELIHLAAWDSDLEALGFWARQLELTGAGMAALCELLAVSLLEGKEEWMKSDFPLAELWTLRHRSSAMHRLYLSSKLLHA